MPSTCPHALRAVVGALSCILVVFFAVVGCTEPSAPFVQPPPTTEAGHLVQQHCGSCHLPPAAASLDKQTWIDGVLPAMAPKLGVDVLWGTEYYPSKDASDTAIAFSDWPKIVDYYRQKAPDSLQLPEPPPEVQTDLPLFRVRRPQWEGARPPATAMVAVDPQTHHIYSSDATAKTLTRWDENLQPTRTGPAGRRYIHRGDARGESVHRSGIRHRP
jgi:hypothetical protein